MNDGKVDGFIYIPISDPRLERIREEFGTMYGPGFDPADQRFVLLLRQASILAEDERLRKLAKVKPEPEKPE